MSADHLAPAIDDTPDDDLALTAAPLPKHLRGFKHTDTGNAERLVAHFGQDLLYCFDWQAWLVWDGRRWLRDPGEHILRLSKRAARSVLREADHETDKDARAHLLKWAGSSESDLRRRSMVNLARSETGIPISPDELDTHPLLLAAANGCIDLSTGTLLAHGRSLLLTKLAPVEHNPEAECPLWMAFLGRIMDGNTDLIEFLQRAVGYSLTGDTSEQCLFLLHGAGANGKSVFVRTIASLLGDYASQASFDTFILRKSDGPRNDIADLRGARFVAAIETEEGRPLAESLVKSLTGGDRVTARFLYSEHFSFDPTFKIWLAANHKPIIRGTDLAIWRRIRLVPFEVTIPEPEQDKHLPEKLARELPGILNWALAGCLAWREDGLGAPPEVTDATASYRSDQDVIGQFVEDCCAVEPSASTVFGTLYSAYSAWASANNENPISSRGFADRLTERGFEGRKEHGERVRIGVGLKS